MDGLVSGAPSQCGDVFILLISTNLPPNRHLHSMNAIFHKEIGFIFENIVHFNGKPCCLWRYKLAGVLIKQ